MNPTSTLYATFVAALTIALAAAPGVAAAGPVDGIDDDVDAPALATCGWNLVFEIGPVTVVSRCSYHEVSVFDRQVFPPESSNAEADPGADAVDAPALATSCLYIEESVGPVTYTQACGYHQVYYEDEQVFAGHVPPI